MWGVELGPMGWGRNTRTVWCGEKDISGVVICVKHRNIVQVLKSFIFMITRTRICSQSRGRSVHYGTSTVINLSPCGWADVPLVAN